MKKPLGRLMLSASFTYGMWQIVDFKIPPACVERRSEYFVLKSVWKACDRFAPLPSVNNPNGRYSLSVTPMISPCDRFARWPCGLAFHFRSPGFGNFCENLKQFGKCRATFRVLEKGKRAGELDLLFTQTPAVELQDETSACAGSAQTEEKHILADTQRHGLHVSKVWMSVEEYRALHR